MITKTYIYALKCPLDNKVKYIGKANDTIGRYRKHISLGFTGKGDNHLKNEWIFSLLENGLKPILEILEEVNINEWKTKEKFYIKQYKEMGYELYNVCGGGNGASFGNSGSFKGKPMVRVVCLSLTGEYLNTFNSIKEATYFCGKKIFNVLVGKRKSSGGYLWLYEKKYISMSKEEIESFVLNCNTKDISKMGISTRFIKGQISIHRKEVHQYTLDNEYIKTWEYAKLASDELGCTSGAITIAAIKGTTSRGFRWSYDKNIDAKKGA